MTIDTGLVPLGRGLLLGAMATGAGLGLASGMRFVAARAARVARVNQPGLSLMAIVANQLAGLGTVRQPLVATRTGLVSLVQRDLLDASRVTRLTARHVAQRKLEPVRLVAASAGRRAVRGLIGLDKLVTRAAGVDLHALADFRRMRIVTSHADARLLRMVRMNVLVARGAGRRRSGTHVVRRMAIGAATVGRDASSADHVQLRVTVAAGRG